MIRNEGRRQDGRAVNTVRPIEPEGGLLPRTHGRLCSRAGRRRPSRWPRWAGKVDAQRTDGIGDTDDRRFYLHYFFRRSSVGETGRVGAANRREAMGHGNLAERALAPIIPSEEQFPFTVRLESTITESNGSSLERFQEVRRVAWRCKTRACPISGFRGAAPSAEAAEARRFLPSTPRRRRPVIAERAENALRRRSVWREIES